MNPHLLLRKSEKRVLRTRNLHIAGGLHPAESELGKGKVRRLGHHAWYGGIKTISREAVPQLTGEDVPQLTASVALTVGKISSSALPRWATCSTLP
jgi:hypothetical protein